MTVLVVDYGMGNIASARRSLEECGAKVRVSDDPAAVTDSDRIVIPGVGAFPKAMERLNARGWTDEIRLAALQNEVPILGICLGMQLLGDVGTEHQDTPGLGLVPGRIELMRPTLASERVPHVGWNEVSSTAGHALFSGIPDGADFYFVHSYRFVPQMQEDIIATTPYCGTTVSAICRGRILGTQFHPEKSSRAGLQLLSNFLAMKA